MQSQVFPALFALSGHVRHVAAALQVLHFAIQDWHYPLS